MVTFPPAIPQLPPSATSWPANLLTAHHALSDIYWHALQVWTQEENDPLCLEYHLGCLESNAIHLLMAIKGDPIGTKLSQWLLQTTELIGKLSDENIQIPQPVTEVHTGLRGCPSKIIDDNFLQEAFSNSRQIMCTELAHTLGVHRNTLCIYMQCHNIEQKYTEISDVDLDNLVSEFKKRQPESGIRYIIGFMRTHGVHVQYCQIIQLVHRIDCLGQALRDRRVKTRRKYHVKRPNALWHIDGHHKLIQWGIVIHGFIDGFCRTVTAMQASDNNQSATVLNLFRQATVEYGIPSCARGDRGGENIDIATYMIMNKGHHRGSFIWGTSTRNCHIEHLWVEVGSQFARRWCAFFIQLERMHMLDAQNPTHLWLLHLLFLNNINLDCQAFQEEWNCHPISGPDTNNKSPKDLCFLGQTQFGVYQDHREHDPALELGDEMTDAADAIARQQQEHVNHQAVHVPSHRNPFRSNEEEAIFFTRFHEVVTQDITPDNFGLTPTEWGSEQYPTLETICIGHRAAKDVNISLADPIWYSRARLWCQALSALSFYLLSID
ncbi:hypothetical protein V8B97DRAFT_1875227 [Scleroderma yunnanense]